MAVSSGCGLSADEGMQLPGSKGRIRFDRVRESPYDEPSWPTACGLRLCIDGCLAAVRLSPLLPPRSMVGQLTLDQHIGVRIPGGQPNPYKTLHDFNLNPTANLVLFVPLFVPFLRHFAAF